MSKDLQELLQLLRVRTPMYIGEHSIIRFSAFLQGYFFAIRLQEGNYEMPRCMSKFTEWLAEKYSITSAWDWEHILFHLANHDDKAALELFWKKWDEFCDLMKNKEITENNDETP